MAVDAARCGVAFIVAVGLCLAFPVWWKTMEVYRASLPKLHQDHRPTNFLPSGQQVTLNFVWLGNFTEGPEVIGAQYARLESVGKALRKQGLLFGFSSPDSNVGSPQQSSEDQVTLTLTDISPTSCSVWKNNQKHECRLRWDACPSAFKELTVHEQDEHLLALATEVALDTDEYTVFLIAIESDISEGVREGLEGSDVPRSAVSNHREGRKVSTVGNHRHAWVSISSTDIQESFVVFVVPRLIRVARHMIQGSAQPDISPGEGVKPKVILSRKPSSKLGTKSSKKAQRERKKDVQLGPLPLAADGSAVLSFSLLNAEPADWVFDWDFAAAEEDILGPLVRTLSPVADLAVESQVLYYARGQVRPTWSPRHQAHTLPASALPFFVNSHEWHLDTSVAAAGRSKLVHLVVYVPAANECPLHFTLPNGQLSPTDGFTVPSWGGVVVWNPPGCVRNDSAPAVVPPAEMRRLLGIQIGQIRTLFGLPAAPEQSAVVQTLSPGVAGFAGWEVAALTRRRATADVVEALSTLRSLSKLVSELSNMVVQDSIAEQMNSALAAASDARGAMLTGAYEKAAVFARTARAQAESAFFHPSLMSLLYFPSEHHLAIYMPLFFPVLVNVCAALCRETLSWGRARCKQRLSQALSRVKQKHS